MDARLSQVTEESHRATTFGRRLAKQTNLESAARDFFQFSGVLGVLVRLPE